MRRATIHARPTPAPAAGAAGIALTAICIALALAGAPAARAGGMKPLDDAALAEVRGADGISFNLNNFSLTSIPSLPLQLTYQSNNGSSLTLSGLDLSRTDDANPFADPYTLSVLKRPGLQDGISLDFPLNTAGNQAWTLTADFSNCDLGTSAACSGTNFVGGTLQVKGLVMRGGGLYLAPSAIADTQGIAFGVGTQLDIGSLAVYSHGRTAGDLPDATDSMALTGIHLANASGGPWMLADLTYHPGLFNAQTDATGSYLHLQIGWPTASSYQVPAASVRIDDITFTSPGASGTPVQTSLGSASIASLQINYADIKFRTGN
jgi:hypothetical protein